MSGSEMPPPDMVPPPEMPLPELPYVPGTPEFEAWAAEDKGPASLALCWTFASLAIIFMAARLYTRWSMFRAFKSDDYWCILGLISVIMATAFATVSVHYGNGQHYQLLSPHQIHELRRYTAAAFTPGVMGFVLPKFAVVTLLTRLLNPSRAHRMFLWGMCILLFFSLVAAVGLLFGQCKPVEAIWDLSLMFEMECIDPRIYVDYSIYCGALSAFIDFYLALYPGFVLFKLQLKLQKKIALTFALSLGCVGGALAIYKTVRLPQGLENPDFSYETADLINWTIVEGSAIIIAATIPVLSPLMDKIFRQYNPFASSRKSSRKSSSKGRKYYQGHPSTGQSGRSGRSGPPDMDEKPSRRAPLDPFDPGMDLAETMVDHSEEDLPRPPKKMSDDLEAQRGGLNTRLSSGSTGSTQVDDDEDHRELGMRQGYTTRGSGIMRTNEVTVTIDPSRTRDDRLERLDRDIPWETPTTSPIEPPPQARSWGRPSR